MDCVAIARPFRSRCKGAFPATPGGILPPGVPSAVSASPPSGPHPAIGVGPSRHAFRHLSGTSPARCFRPRQGEKISTGRDGGGGGGEPAQEEKKQEKHRNHKRRTRPKIRAGSAHLNVPLSILVRIWIRTCFRNLCPDISRGSL